jgi:hypothetical protein
MKQIYCNELIKKLQFIQQNRCSLSEDDKKVIDEVISLLKRLIIETNEKQTSGLETFCKVVELLSKFFIVGHEISNIITQMS